MGLVSTAGITSRRIRNNGRNIIKQLSYLLLAWACLSQEGKNTARGCENRNMWIKNEVTAGGRILHYK
jgi:hypothetical protein